MLVTPPPQAPLSDEDYGWSNDFMMADHINDAALHPVNHLPIKKPTMPNVKKKVP